jgi:hypothetical protein
MPIRLRSLVLCTAASAAFLVAPHAGASAGASARAAAPVPTATMVTSIARVGALFFPSVLGSSLLFGLPHDCSGSVVHSPGHDLVLTAAHCLAGSGVGYDFVPGYHDRLAPYGVWSAQRVYVNASWVAHQDPQHDYAFLVMAPEKFEGARRNIEDVTGAYRLGSAPPPGSPVTVDAYLAGVGDRPITCTNDVYDTGGFPSFDCAGYANGTSGGPWLSGSSLVGAIGGLHQGGCLPSTSYTSAFGADTMDDWTRAVTRAPANFVSPAGPSGC